MSIVHPRGQQLKPSQPERLVRRDLAPPEDAIRTPDGQVWVTTQHAARLARRSTKTIRVWIAAERLPAVEVPLGSTTRYAVNWPRLLELLAPVPLRSRRQQRQSGATAEAGLRAFDTGA